VINFKQLKSVLDQGKDPPAKNQQKYSPLEKLYMESEQAIMLQNQNIYQETKPIPSCEARDIQNFHVRHYGLLSFYQEMQANFEKIEKEINVFELRRLLTYLEEYLTYMRAVIHCSNELVTFRTSVETQTEAVVALNRKLQQTHTPEALKLIEVEMEEILDQAEAFKDKLEDFPIRNISAQTVMPYYECYQQKLHLLQEDLLEASAWIH